MSLTPDRLDKNIRRCEEAVHSAGTLLEEMLYEQSISRAYYSIIHAVMLYLTEIGEGTRIPSEAEETFTEEFVQEQGLDPVLWEIFREVRQTKKDSESNYLVKYSREEAGKAIDRAREFLDITKRHFGVAN